MEDISADSNMELDHQVRQSSILSRVTAIVVGALLVIFFLLTMSSTATILEKMESVKNDPFPMIVASGHVETVLVQIRTMSMRVIYDDSEATATELRSVFRSADEELTRNLNLMSASNFVNKDTLQSLQDGCETLRTRQAQLIKMCEQPETTNEQIRDYVTDEIYPLIGGLLQLSTQITNESMRSVDEIYMTVNDACRQTIFIIWILMIAVTVSIFVYLSILRRKNQREEYLTKNLKETLAVAQSASAAKSTFLSSMSHDIRTPMNAIMGLTTIAKENSDDLNKVSECLDRIALSSKHLLSLINDVLDMSEIESGKIALSNEVFYFPEFMAEMLSITQHQASVKGLHLKVNMGDLKHDCLIGDTVRLSQMLMNLISNAVKYTPKDGYVYIDVSEEPGAEAGYSNFRFVVEDTGIGMDSDFLIYIFEPFERERNETTPFTEGAGLGMAITKNVVDMMHGSITVESTLGEGSRFTVIVPIQIAPENMRPEIATNSSMETGDDNDSDSNMYGRILLVEDDALNREIAIELIKTTGVEVEIACDGLEAVEQIRNVADGYYDLVFMDCQMPRMGGTEATKEIRIFEEETGRSRVPIVAMTANALNEDRARTIKAGMDGFLAKPINIKELKRTMSQYLKRT